MIRAFHEYQTYGALFIEELLSVPRQWDKIQENLEKHLSLLKDNDIYGLYKYAVLDKNAEMVEYLNSFYGKNTHYDTLVDTILQSQSVWFMAFHKNDYDTIKALSGYPKFDCEFLTKLLSTPRYSNFGTEQTFLTELLERKCFQTLEFLLENGVGSEIFDKNQHSLLNIASQHYECRLVEKILKTGFPVNFQNQYNNKLCPSPLHSAFLSKGQGVEGKPQDFIKTLEILFEYGADPNITDQYANSPLFYAVYMPLGCAKKALELFIEHGVDFDKKGNYNFNLIEQFKHIQSSMLSDSDLGLNATQLLENVDILREKYKIKSSLGESALFKENKNILKI